MDNDEKLHWLGIFKQFLVDNKAENFWTYVPESELLQLSHPTSWITSVFVWSKTDEGYNYWDRINNLWYEITNH